MNLKFILIINITLLIQAQEKFEKKELNSNNNNKKKLDDIINMIDKLTAENEEHKINNLSKKNKNEEKKTLKKIKIESNLKLKVTQTPQEVYINKEIQAFRENNQNENNEPDLNLTYPKKFPEISFRKFTDKQIPDFNFKIKEFPLDNLPFKKNKYPVIKDEEFIMPNVEAPNFDNFLPNFSEDKNSSFNMGGFKNDFKMPIFNLQNTIENKNYFEIPSFKFPFNNNNANNYQNFNFEIPKKNTKTMDFSKFDYNIPFINLFYIPKNQNSYLNSQKNNRKQKFDNQIHNVNFNNPKNNYNFSVLNNRKNDVFVNSQNDNNKNIIQDDFKFPNINIPAFKLPEFNKEISLKNLKKNNLNSNLEINKKNYNKIRQKIYKPKKKYFEPETLTIYRDFQKEKKERKLCANCKPKKIKKYFEPETLTIYRDFQKEKKERKLCANCKQNFSFDLPKMHRNKNLNTKDKLYQLKNNYYYN